MAILLAATLGTAIPVGLSRFGVDPAVATGPFVTTALDVLGLLHTLVLLLASLFGQRGSDTARFQRLLFALSIKANAVDCHPPDPERGRCGDGEEHA